MKETVVSCDRCAQTIERYLGDLLFANTGLTVDLCSDCTKAFNIFMVAKGRDQWPPR